jgi:glycosyltransferase involved in cell wall biosynthesis
MNASEVPVLGMILKGYPRISETFISNEILLLSEVPVLGMILKGYPRISETFISNEILLLEKLGFTLHLFSMRQPRESFSHESVKRIKAPVDYLPETLLLPLPRFLYHNILLAQKTPLAYAGALKTAWRRFLRTRKIATLKHLLQAGYLVNHLLPGRKIVHFHAHFAHSPASVALFASQLSGIPFGFTAHAKDIYTSDPRQLSEKIDSARFVVTCTEYNRDHLLKITKGVATPIHRIYHGTDLSLFNEKKIEQSASPYRILTVARLTAKKGLPTVYRALRMLCDRGIQLQHTLIGDGDQRKKILSLIKKLKLNHFTRWLGTQPHNVVLEHYRQADLFVLGCEGSGGGNQRISDSGTGGGRQDRSAGATGFSTTTGQRHTPPFNRTGTATQSHQGRTCPRKPGI